MSKELEKQTPAKDKPESKAPANQKKTITDKKTSSASGMKTPLILSVTFLMALSAVFFYAYKNLSKLEQNINQATLNNESLIKQLDNRINDTSSRFTSIQKHLNELQSKQNVLEQAALAPVEQEVHINKDYAFAEIEHLLIIASYNLALDNNVVTALSAMEAADARLNGINDSRVIEVREQIISDMNALRSLNQADLSGLGLFLSDLVGRVDNLPLKEGVVIESVEHPIKKPDEQVNSIEQFFLLVWEELKSPVVITRDENVSKARLLPDEVYFIRANIKLELANARFAVFNRDTQNLKASINHIQAWLNDYFDLSDADTRNVYDSLTKMQKLELAFPKLDISSSLESVRALIRYQEEVENVSEQDAIEPLQ